LVTAVAQTAAPTAETATLKGKITDTKTKEELVGATIFVVGTYKGTATNLDGEYTLPGIKAGLWKLCISSAEATDIDAKNISGRNTSNSVTFDLFIKSAPGNRY
jgi:hypothetical protein